MKKSLKKSLLLFSAIGTFLISPFISKADLTQTESYHTGTMINGTGGHIASGYVWTLTDENTGKTYEAYCKDPLTVGPGATTKYQEISTSEAGSKMLAQYKYIFQNASNTNDRITAIKLLTMQNGYNSGSANYPVTTGNTRTSGSEAVKRVYNTWFNNDGTLKYDDNDNSTSTDEDTSRIRSLVSDANKETKYNTAIPTFTLKTKDNTKAVIELKTNGATGTLTVTTTNATSSETSRAITATDSTLTIIITSENTCASGDLWTYNLKFDYTGSVATSDCEMKVFQAVGCAATNCQNQQLIACDDSGSPTAGNGTIENSGQGNCSGTPADCEPEVISKDPNGLEICDENGTTIIEITELPDLTNLKACIFDDGLDRGDNPDVVTEKMLENDPNGLCEVFCTEDYYLELPGPDARSFDEDVFINSGTFFTITGDLKDESTYTCYSVLHYDELKRQINNIRKGMMDIYNKQKIHEATRNYDITDYQCNPHPSASDPAVTEYDTCYMYTFPNAEQFSIDSDGKITASTPWSASGAGFSSYGEALSTAETIKAQYSTSYNLSSESQSANDKIDNLIDTVWKECLDWDFRNEFMTLVECPGTELGFSYYDGQFFGDPEIKSSPTTFGAPSTTTTKENPTTETPYTGNCDQSGCGSANSTENVTNADYTYNSIKGSTTYTFDNGFWNFFDGSDPVWEKDVTAGTDTTNATLINGFPISLETTQGQYWYEYTYDKIGHFLESTCEAGRLTDVIDAAGIDASKEHSCYYDVNSCYDCPVTCSSGNCDFDDECDENCIVSCVGGGCFFDINSGYLFTYRTISLNNPFPTALLLNHKSNEKILAYAPSNTNKAPTSNWTSTKGKYTERVMNCSEDSRCATPEDIYEKDPEYSVHLDPGTINKIRQYNESNGDYLNSTLTCTKFSKTYSGKVHEYANCTSNFLEDPIFNGQTIRDPENSGAADFVSYPKSLEQFIGPAWK